MTQEHTQIIGLTIKTVVSFYEKSLNIILQIIE